MCTSGEPRATFLTRTSVPSEVLASMRCNCAGCQNISFSGSRHEQHIMILRGSRHGLQRLQTRWWDLFSMKGSSQERNEAEGCILGFAETLVCFASITRPGRRSRMPNRRRDQRGRVATSCNQDALSLTQCMGESRLIRYRSQLEPSACEHKMRHNRLTSAARSLATTQHVNSLLTLPKRMSSNSSSKVPSTV